MKNLTSVAPGILVLFALAIILPAGSALAGPPLLCHPIDIGESVSLPWGENAWSNDKITLDDAAFLALTLQLLSEDAPVLVRMETIRRATIHAAERPNVAADILAVLRARVDKSEESGEADPLAMFDLGYLEASYTQMNMATDHNSTGSGGRKRRQLEVTDEPPAYDLVTRASDLAGRPADMEFALALLTLQPAQPAHRQHLQNAVAGAVDQSLLAVNLVNHFGERGQTLNDFRTSLGMKDDGERR